MSAIKRIIRGEVLRIVYSRSREAEEDYGKNPLCELCRQLLWSFQRQLDDSSPRCSRELGGGQKEKSYMKESTVSKRNNRGGETPGSH